jgi:hypothetical protein
LAASIVAMALPLESAEAIGETRGGDARGGRGGDAESEAEGGDARGGRGGDAESEAEGGDATASDFESDGDGNEGNLAEGGIITSGATDGAGGEARGGAGGEARGGDASSTYIVNINNS